MVEFEFDYLKLKSTNILSCKMVDTKPGEKWDVPYFHHEDKAIYKPMPEP